MYNYLDFAKQQRSTYRPRRELTVSEKFEVFKAIDCENEGRPDDEKDVEMK